MVWFITVDEPWNGHRAIWQRTLLTTLKCVEDSAVLSSDYDLGLGVWKTYIWVCHLYLCPWGNRLLYRFPHLWNRAHNTRCLTRLSWVLERIKPVKHLECYPARWKAVGLTNKQESVAESLKSKQEKGRPFLNIREGVLSLSFFQEFLWVFKPSLQDSPSWFWVPSLPGKWRIKTERMGSYRMAFSVKCLWFGAYL